MTTSNLLTFFSRVPLRAASTDNAKHISVERTLITVFLSIISRNNILRAEDCAYSCSLPNWEFVIMLTHCRIPEIRPGIRQRDAKMGSMTCRSFTHIWNAARSKEFKVPDGDISVLVRLSFVQTPLNTVFTFTLLCLSTVSCIHSS